MLSKEVQYASLYHTAPKDDSLPLAMAQMMFYFRWAWMEHATSDDMRDKQFLSAWGEEMAKKGIGVAFSETVSECERPWGGVW